MTKGSPVQEPEYYYLLLSLPFSLLSLSADLSMDISLCGCEAKSLLCSHLGKVRCDGVSILMRLFPSPASKPRSMLPFFRLGGFPLNHTSLCLAKRIFGTFYNDLFNPVSSRVFTLSSFTPTSLS